MEQLPEGEAKLAQVPEPDGQGTESRAWGTESDEPGQGPGTQVLAIQEKDLFYHLDPMNLGCRNE